MQRAMRKSVREEFRGGFWKSPSGARVPWEPKKPFGNRPGGPALGGTQSRLLAGWMGGPGGYSRREVDRVAIGTRHPAAAVHRGGSLISVNPRKRTRVKAKKRARDGRPAMFWFLGLTYGAWIRPEKLLTEGLVIPARPHATRNPDLETDLAGIFLKRLLGR